LTVTTSLDTRARRIVWGFLVGVTVIQGGAIFALFPGVATDPGPLLRYTIVPIGGWAAWALASVTTFAYVAYAAARSPVMRAHMLKPGSWGPFWGVRLIAIPMSFVTGFFEEVFFRKYLMTVIERDGHGPLAQIVVSAAVFGVAHGIWAVAGGNWRAAIGPVISTSILGLLLAIAFILGDRSLAPCVAAHIAINLFLEPWLIMTSATRSWGKR
jgi:membrane protease YdiL (CAAX protease family)